MRQVAAVERQVHDLALFHYLRDGAVFGLDHVGIGGHFHGFGGGANFQGHILRDVLRHLQDDAALAIELESRGCHFQGVGADGQVGETEDAVGAGGEGMKLPRVDLRHFHGGVGDGSTAGIAYATVHFRHGDFLGAGDGNRGKHEGNGQQNGRCAGHAAYVVTRELHRGYLP